MCLMSCSSITSTTLVKSLENTKKVHAEVREELCHFAAVAKEGEVNTAAYQDGSVIIPLRPVSYSLLFLST